MVKSKSIADKVISMSKEDLKSIVEEINSLQEDQRKKIYSDADDFCEVRDLCGRLGVTYETLKIKETEKDGYIRILAAAYLLFLKEQQDKS